jgi:hypothetical protein
MMTTRVYMGLWTLAKLASQPCPPPQARLKFQVVLQALVVPVAAWLRAGQGSAYLGLRMLLSSALLPRLVCPPHPPGP